MLNGLIAGMKKYGGGFISWAKAGQLKIAAS